MAFFMSLFLATFLVVVGYFVLYAAQQSQGRMATFGSVLAGWLFVLAGVAVLAGLLAPFTGMDRMRGMPMMTSEPSGPSIEDSARRESVRP